ncbi:MAG: sulfatase [Opitutales bacterium]|nr:sulfatase [Opitutales bacterium]
MKKITLFLGLLFPLSMWAGDETLIEKTKGMNVLFIGVEDWSAEAVGCYGNDIVKTPNVDKLAKKGVQFNRAYCQGPVCNPSRASFGTGLRPDSTLVYGNGDGMDEVIPEGVKFFADILQQNEEAEIVTSGKLVHIWSEAFRFIDGFDQVYYTHAYDKPYEGFKGEYASVMTNEEVMEDAELVYKFLPDSKVVARLHQKREEREARKAAGEPNTWALRKPFQQLMAEQVGDSGMSPEEMEDGCIALHAKDLIGKFAENDQQFFFSVGFYAPHTPLLAPKKYVDMYDPEEMKLSPVLAENDQGVPMIAKRNGANYDIFNGLYPEYGPTPERQKEAIAAYYACSTYIDDQIGILLEALEENGIADNTVVIFFSDHGFHLGEHGCWSKFTLFEQSTRVPMVVYLPGAKGNGKVCDEIVELVDFAPSIYELWDVKEEHALEGISWLPLLEHPEQEWKKAAYSSIPINGLGRSVRTKRYRYAEWREDETPDFTKDNVHAVELYDLESDPWEQKNLAGLEEFVSVESELRELLYKGWQAALPN